MKIIADAGHYPRTKGKRAPDDSMREYHFNSAVAKYLRIELHKYKNVSVLFSHSDLRDVPLDERVRFANNHKADLFVSIHANAHGNGSEFTGVEGVETFVYNSKPKEAVNLANKIQAEMLKVENQKNRGVKTSAFYVLKHTKMTACLVECAFMTNKKELALLKSDAYRRKVAKALAKAIAKTYKLELKPVATPTKPVAKPAPKPVAKPSEGKAIYQVVAGSFANKDNALKAQKDLKKRGVDSFLQVQKK